MNDDFLTIIRDRISELKSGGGFSRDYPLPDEAMLRGFEQLLARFQPSPQLPPVSPQEQEMLYALLFSISGNQIH
jgi:hypothetical protein